MEADKTTMAVRLRKYKLPAGASPRASTPFDNLELFHDPGRQIAWAAPSPDQDALDSFYANDFRRMMGKATDPATYLADRYYRVRARSQVEWVKAVASPEGRWLDVGAGFGVLLSRVRDVLPAWSRVAIEPDRDAQPYLRRIADVQTDFNGFWSGTLFEPAQFDVISLSHVLEHLIDPVQSLRVIANYLKPGGYALVEVPHDDLAELSSETRGGDLPHLWFFSKAGLAETVRDGGFDCVRIGVLGVRRAADRRSLIDRLWGRIGRLRGGGDRADAEWYREADDRCDLRMLAQKPDV